MGFLFVGVYLLILAAMAGAFGAAAVQPSQRTVRAGAIALLAFPAFVVVVALVTAAST